MQTLKVLASAALVTLTGATPGYALFETPVAFTVRNLNRSLLACPADGQTYTIEGHLVGPDSLATSAGPDSVTLYLHGFGFGEWLWRFRDVPGLDHAGELAALGHASVVIDRLGYDSSGHPHGLLSCWGSQADVVHQIIGALKEGTYSAVGGAVSFATVAVAGHSAGAAIAQVTAYSFNSVDALVLVSYADQGASDAAIAAGVEGGTVCLRGGEEAEEGGPTGYTYYGQTPEEFESLQFHSASPTVVDAARARRNRDPCGDLASLLPEQFVVSPALLRTIDLPVLLACGTGDAMYHDSACVDQAAHFTGSADVTLERVQNAGHAIPLEAGAPSFRQTLSSWLGARGF